MLRHCREEIFDVACVKRRLGGEDLSQNADIQNVLNKNILLRCCCVVCGRGGATLDELCEKMETSYQREKRENRTEGSSATLQRGRVTN